MNVKELIEKSLNGEALTDAEKKALSEWQQPDVEKIANDRAAKARREAEADAAKAKAALDAAMAQLEELKQKDAETLTTAEKSAKRMEALEAQIKNLMEANAKAEADRARLIRDGKIDKLMSGINLIDGVSRDMVRGTLSTLLSDVDLDDEAVVTGHLEQFKNANSAIIAAGDFKGGGSKGGQYNSTRNAPDLSSLTKIAMTGKISDAKKALDDATAAVQTSRQ